MDPRTPEPPRGPAHRNARRVATLVVLVALTAGVIGGLRANPLPANPHGKFKEECSLCHDASGWTPARVSQKFDHGKYGFPLTGAHAASQCLACHQSLDFSKPETRCASCHEDPHRGELGSECERCHGARSFLDRARMLRAHQLTRFPLLGGHAALDCDACHKPTAQGQMQYVGARPECIACHQADYNAATNPDHKAGGFPTDCTECHSSRSWLKARFDHQNTLFPLTGAHRATPCAACHGDGVYKGKSTACASCHQAAYTATTDPPHGPSGFPLACETCHNTTSWAGATFDHANTQFPLTGAHVALACIACHGDGVYKGKPTTCVSCHQADYNATTDPSHSVVSFPLACESCHNTTAWTGARFDHDTSWFPIYSGRHAGLWSSCTTCHTNATNYTQFTCFSCHPHDSKTQTDSNHSGVSGYVYDSAHCYSCHPRGTT